MMRLLASAGIALMVAPLAACSHDPGHAGAALDGDFTARSTGGYAALRPGGQMAIIFVELHNGSNVPVKLLSVRLYGDPGLTSVIRYDKLQFAPGTPARTATALGGYPTYPPASADSRSAPCIVQRLQPVRNYELQPNATTRLLELVKATRPGRYTQTGVVATYRSGSTTQTQRLAATITGVVSTHAKRRAVDPVDRRCTRQTSLLSGWLSGSR